MSMATSEKHPDISPEELQAYREAFQVFDHDGDGSISTTELHQVMKSLGQKVTAEQIQDTINEVDLDRNGSVDFDEFVKMMTLKHRGIDLDAELREAFDLFDVDNNGYITKDAIFQLLNSLGENVTRSDVDQMIAEVDQDGDGHISYEEFACFIKDNK